MRDGLQMSRVHAAADPAFVVQLQPIGDRAAIQLERNPMSPSKPAAAIRSNADGDASVAVAVGVARPQPTARVGLGRYHRPETPFYRLRAPAFHSDRKSVVPGKSVSLRVDLGGRGAIKKKKS